MPLVKLSKLSFIPKLGIKLFMALVTELVLVFFPSIGFVVWLFYFILLM